VDADGGADLKAGAAALSSGDWLAVRSAFREAIAVQESPEALSGLALALWSLGETRESLRCLEAAYAGLLRRPDPVQAAIMAVVLSLNYNANLGNRAVSAAWAARAVRVADPMGIPGVSGWVLLAKAATCVDPHQAQTLRVRPGYWRSRPTIVTSSCAP